MRTFVESTFSDLSHKVSEMSPSSHDDREKPLKRDLNETLKECSNTKDPLCVYTHIYVDLYIHTYIYIYIYETIHDL